MTLACQVDDGIRLRLLLTLPVCNAQSSFAVCQQLVQILCQQEFTWNASPDQIGPSYLFAQDLVHALINLSDYQRQRIKRHHMPAKCNPPTRSWNSRLQLAPADLWLLTTDKRCSRPRGIRNPASQADHGKCRIALIDSDAHASTSPALGASPPLNTRPAQVTASPFSWT